MNLQVLFLFGWQDSRCFRQYSDFTMTLLAPEPTWPFSLMSRRWALHFLKASLLDRSVRGTLLPLGLALATKEHCMKRKQKNSV